MNTIGFDTSKYEQKDVKKKDFVANMVISVLSNEQDPLYAEEKDLILSQAIMKLINQYNPINYEDFFNGMSESFNTTVDATVNQLNRYVSYSKSSFIENYSYKIAMLINDYYVNARLTQSEFHKQTRETFGNLINCISPYYRLRTIEKIRLMISQKRVSELDNVYAKR